MSFVGLTGRWDDRRKIADLAAIREVGADNTALVLQGRLAAGDVIAEAGLSAQPKAKPPKM